MFDAAAVAVTIEIMLQSTMRDEWAKSTARVSASSIRSFLFVAFSIGLERYSWIDVRLRKKCDQLSCQKRSSTTHQPIFQIRCWSNALLFLLFFFGRFQTIGQASRPYFILAFVFRSLFSSVAIWPSLSTQMAPTRKQRKREFKNKTWIKQSERKETNIQQRCWSNKPNRQKAGHFLA